MLNFPLAPSYPQGALAQRSQLGAPFLTLDAAGSDEVAAATRTALKDPVTGRAACRQRCCEGLAKTARGLRCARPWDSPAKCCFARRAWSNRLRAKRSHPKAHPNNLRSSNLPPTRTHCRAYRAGRMRSPRSSPRQRSASPRHLSRARLHCRRLCPRHWRTRTILMGCCRSGTWWPIPPARRTPTRPTSKDCGFARFVTTASPHALWHRSMTR